jgi:hypothetical protein
MGRFLRVLSSIPEKMHITMEDALFLERAYYG